MKTNKASGFNRTRAFTLMELLVVIAIIAILAALIFPAVTGIKDRMRLAKAKAEMAQVITAIEAFKAKYGHYPPDNPSNPAINPLYFELMGTIYTNAGAFRGYVTKDLDSQIDQTRIQPVFGRSGLVNCTRTSDLDAAAPAQKFLNELKPGQRGDADVATVTVRLLACSVEWPDKFGSAINILGFPPKLNPWRYNSSNPTNSSRGFDLWVDLYLGGKTNRVGNWSDKPVLVYQPGQ